MTFGLEMFKDLLNISLVQEYQINFIKSVKGPFFYKILLIFKAVYPEGQRICRTTPAPPSSVFSIHSAALSMYFLQNLGNSSVSSDGASFAFP